MASQAQNDVQINIQDDTSSQVQTNLSSNTDTTHVNESATVPFVPSQLYHLARRTLEIADYYGEKLAYFFGITSPKYEAEIREYERRINEQKMRKEKEANEYSGWNTEQFLHPTQNLSPDTFARGPDPPPKY